MNSSLAQFNATGAMVPLFTLYVRPVGIAFFTGGIASLFGNIMIIAALIASRDLRKNRCNLFVGNLAVADAISSCSLTYSGIQALEDGFTFTFRQDVCYYSVIPGIISFNAGSMIILGIGVDRAISLWRPMFYKNLSTKYILCGICAAWLFGVSNAIVAYFYITHDVIVPMCGVPDGMREVAMEYWNNSNIVINILVVAAYAAAYYKAKILAKTQSSNNDQVLRKNRLLKSLIICAWIYVVGWMVTMAVIFLVTLLSTSPSVIFHCVTYVGILANLNVGCNFYVYYARSEEYRRVFKKLLGQKTFKNSSVAPSNVIMLRGPSSRSGNPASEQ